ncbi:MAG: fatty acid desaturase [Gemmatimonadota bacterium]|nr:MAG: fatty acid desaturase [Gemmatimonadota bacterium]
MSSVPEGFAYSAEPEPHKTRTQAILRQHPEVRKLIGRNPFSFPAIVALVALQLVAAWWVVGKPWWVVLLLAYTVGAVANHALFVQIHECSHNLIFKKRVWNTLAGILANIPSVFPTSVSFQRYHLKHHSYQGVYELDADIPSEWEARLVGNSAIRKALWLALFPVFAAVHTLRIKEVQVFDRWVLLNWVIVIGADIAIVLTLGWTAFLYLLASMFFAAGLHPLGARWIQRHYLMGSTQETYSYYGVMNRFAFNVGYHNEHHDFPSIPWHRLPRLKAMASEWYDGLEAHNSWSRLLVRYVFDPSITLYSRMLRVDRGGEAGAAAQMEQAQSPEGEAVGAGIG